MAVAVKNTPETETSGRFDRLGVASLAGVVYVLGSLAVVFYGLPAVWDLLGLTTGGFLGIALLGVAMIAVAAGLVFLGARLMGPTPRPGLKAGVFIGIVFLLITLLVCRWVGGILEGWIYSGLFGDSGPMIGTAIFAALSALFVWWLFRRFFWPNFERWLIKLESQGWFSFASYKKGQGLRVRRGTMLGILALVVSGIWVMLNHRFLERGSGVWSINVPFTGQVVVQDVGDAGQDETLKQVDRFRVVDQKKGATEKLAPGQVLDKSSAIEAVWEVAQKKSAAAENLIAEFEKRRPTVLDRTDEATLGSWIGELRGFQRKLAQKDEGLLLLQQEIDREIARRQEDFRNERRVAQGRQTTLEDDLKKLVGWAESNRLPVVAPLLTRFQERDLIARFDPSVTRVVRNAAFFNDLRDNQDFQVLDASGNKQFAFTEGAIINRDMFERGVEAIKERKLKGDPAFDVTILAANAEKAAPPVRPIKGEPVYTSITLLPAVKYTVPLLLLVLGIWFAWRVVNLPTFGDFLIATEAELNKVSWTTRTRLVQDTIVVLVTVILMAMFLFLVDLTWAKVLSWEPIGVLQVQEAKDKKLDETELKW